MNQGCHQRRFPLMGTTAHVVLVGGATGDLDRVEARLHSLERRWSRFLQDSELSKLNANAGVPCIVSPETYDLVANAIDAWSQTGGSFDPTVGATMVAAGYDRSFSELGRTASGSSLPAPGGGNIVLHPYGPAVQLPTNVQLDLGGIAKGAAADLIALELLANGSLDDKSLTHESLASESDARSVAAAVQGCLINIGGDLRAAGAAPRPGGWRITLDCPGSAESRSLAIAAGAVCTSTKIKRRWISDAGQQHHLRDPATGHPLETGIASVTIIGERAAQAEVLTKAMFAAGPEDGIRLANRAGVTGILVLDNGTVQELPGLSQFLATSPQAEYA